MANLYIAQAYGKYVKNNQGNTGEIKWQYSTTGSDNIFVIDNNGMLQSIGKNGNDDYAIYYLGVQSFTGLIFNINSNKTAAESTVRMGQTGIFELNLFDSLPIEQVTFENLNELNDINNYCLIDIIYEAR